MKPPEKSKERYVSLSKLAKDLDMDRKRVHYHTVKSRLRTFIFGGVRHIEASDAKCLVESFEILDKADYSNTISKINLGDS